MNSTRTRGTGSVCWLELHGLMYPNYIVAAWRLNTDVMDACLHWYHFNRS